METCKCGAVKITKVSGLPGTRFQIGCPACKTTAEAKV